MKNMSDKVKLTNGTAGQIVDIDKADDGDTIYLVDAGGDMQWVKEADME